MSAFVAVALVAGLVIGSARQSDDAAAAAVDLEVLLIPLLGDLDATWNAGRDGRSAISDALDGLRRGQGGPEESDIDAWLESHDNLVLRLAGLDLRPEARGVQRHAITAVTLSRDAVEVMGRAAAFNEGVTRAQLVGEATRLRMRSEQQVLAVRASVDDLGGRRRRVSPLPVLPSFAVLTP